MYSTHRTATAAALSVLVSAGSASLTTAAALPGKPFNYTIFTYPGATQTIVSAIDGDRIVGYYHLNGTHGFVYDGQSFATIDYPGAAHSGVVDIDGDTIVGFFDGNRRRGYRYRDGVFTTIDHPLTTNAGGNGTNPSGISGDTIVGVYLDDSFSTQGFIFDGSTYQTFDYPNAPITTITGIDAGRIIGQGGTTGYLHEGASFTTISIPGADSTAPLGIHNDTVVGYAFYQSEGSSAFVLRDGQYQLFAPPSPSSQTSFVDVWGNKVIGHYVTGSGGGLSIVSFVMTIPEPASASLLAITVALVPAVRRRLRCVQTVPLK
jgi:hypothetical protein